MIVNGTIKFLNVISTRMHAFRFLVGQTTEVSILSEMLLFCSAVFRHLQLILMKNYIYSLLLKIG